MRLFHRGCRALAAVSIVASGLVMTGSAPASAATATTTTISPYRQTRNAGQIATWVIGLAAGDTRLSHYTVEWWTRPTTTTSWTHYATKTTDMNGHSTISFAVRTSTYVRVTFAGTDTYAASASGTAGVVAAANSLGQKAVTEASRHQGAPYQYGAAGPTRFDCSGLTLYVFSRFGKSLPHNSGQQYSSVRHIAKSSAQVGDLIFIYGSGGISHVGIYAGSGYMWHAPHTGSYVQKAKIWTSSYYVGRVA
jgi:cell wall-associated NlpC family hydrolase